MLHRRDDNNAHGGGASTSAPSAPDRSCSAESDGGESENDGTRTEIDELSAILDEAERREPQFPHRRRRLRLLHSLGRRILQAHLDWIEEVEREFAGPIGTTRS
jgi:hypothetical protein